MPGGSTSRAPGQRQRQRLHHSLSDRVTFIGCQIAAARDQLPQGRRLPLPSSLCSQNQTLAESIAPEDPTAQAFIRASRLSQSGDRLKHHQYIRQSLLTGLIRRQKGWQCLQKGGGIQQIAESCREIIPQLRRTEPAFLQQ